MNVLLILIEVKKLLLFLFLFAQPKCLRLPSNTNVTMITNYKDPNSPNTVLTDYYQCSVADPREVAMAQLLVVSYRNCLYTKIMKILQVDICRADTMSCIILA